LDVDFFVEVHVGCGLEKLGGSVDRVLGFFPNDRFVVRGRQESDTAFRPLAPNDLMFRKRFFLLAQARDSKPNL
jgi:hypothetical protein